MPHNKDFVLRLEIIDECLRNRQRVWTLKNLIDGVNDKLNNRYGKTIKKRTIQGDIKYLIEDVQAPIDRRKNGRVAEYYYTDPDYSIKKLPIKGEEVSFLLDAVNILKQVNDFQILSDVYEIINKLQKKAKVSLDDPHPIIQFEKHTKSIGSQYIDTLYAAIKMKMTLRITYKSFKSDAPKEIIFHPYLLKVYRNRWFVIGRKENSNLITNFALDRIKGIRNSSEFFRQNDLLNIDTHFDNVIGVTTPVGENIQNVDVKVYPVQAPYVLTKPIHHSQQVIKEFKNGTIIIRLRLICNYELQAVLLGFGGDIEVLKPITLRQRIKENISLGLKRYEP